MKNYSKMLAYLKVAYHNLITLHHGLTGDAGWFGNHDKLGEWYDTLSEASDDLTETGLALGAAEPSIRDAATEFASDILPVKTRGLPETYKLAGNILRTAAQMMIDAEGEVPGYVVSKLQEYEYTLMKEANYKITHALDEKRTSPVWKSKE